MKKLLLFLLLCAPAFSQVIVIGPLSGTPVDPSACQPDPQGQTAVCFAKDGVHVSISGSVFGGALCDSTNPVCVGPQGVKGDKGDKGNPGDSGPQGVQGIQGVPGSVQVGQTLTGTLTCSNGLGNTNHQATCTFLVTKIQ